MNDDLNNAKVGDGISIKGYSDVKAGTIFKRTPKTITFAYDNATLLNGVDSNEPDALKFSAGGFLGHTSGTQRYAYSPDPKGVKFTARLTKTGWRCKGNKAIAGRHEYYDFNF